MTGGGLTLSLKPREKFLVGGCLLENGPKKSSIRIPDDSVFVLRLSDALHPDEIRTPVTRAYNCTQMILACEVEEQVGKAELLERLDQLRTVFTETPAAEALEKALNAVQQRRYHATMAALKTVIGFEAALLERLLLEQLAATRSLVGEETREAAAAR